MSNYKTTLSGVLALALAVAAFCRYFLGEGTADAAMTAFLGFVTFLIGLFAKDSTPTGPVVGKTN